MFGTYSYHKTIYYTSAVFSTLFNDLDVVRKDASGNVLNQERVPIAQGPRQKWLARNDEREDLDDTKVAIKLPRMSYEMTGINYDSSRQVSKHCKDLITASTSGDANQSAKFSTGVPYSLNFELNIYGKTLDDVHQLVEQILPTFKPSYSVVIRPISDQTTIQQNIKFILTSVTPTHVYEGSFTDRTTYIYTLSFDAKVMFYGPITDSEVIKTAIVNIYEHGTTNLIKRETHAVNPQSATEDDVYTIDLTVEYGDDVS